MRGTLRAWIVCAAVAYAGVAAAAPKARAPKVSAPAQFKAAAAEHGNGNYQKALEHIDKGLAVAPKDLKLLGLKGTVLLELRDYPRALAAYQAYLKAGAKGANEREAKKIVDKLLAVETTFLDITFAGATADVYLDSKTLGVFCPAAPTCKQAVLPGPYQVIAERPGFERWTGPVTVESGQTAKLAITLVEEPSLLTVQAAPAGARVTVDGAPHAAPAKVAAGRHRVVVALDGHAEEQREIVAREGQPLELAVSLTPLVPVRIEPPGAELLLDGKPVVIRAGRVAVPRDARVLIVRAPGFLDQTIEIPAERGPSYDLDVKLAPELAATGASDAPPPSPGVFTFRRKLAVAAGGVSLAAAGAGVALTLRAGNVEDDGTLAATHLREKRTLQSHLAYGAAGLVAAIAIGLWLDGAPGAVSVTPRLDAGGGAGGASAGLDLAVRF